MSAVVGCSETVDLAYIRGARVAPAPEAVASEAGHRIERDSATVLILRKWDAGKKLTVDDETYQKLSIELPTIEVGRRIELPSERVRVLLTEGAVAWAHKGGRCVSSDATGELTVDRYEDGELEATLDMQFWCEYQDKTFILPPKNVRLRGRFRFEEVGIDDLNAWLGGGGLTP